MKRQHIVTRDRLERRLGDVLPVRVSVAEYEAREHARRDRPRLVASLSERNEALCAQPLECLRRKRWADEHVGNNVERRRKFARNALEGDGASLPGDSDGHRRPEELQRGGERFAILRSCALTHHRGRHVREPATRNGVRLVVSTRAGDRERHERQVVLFGHDEFGAIGERGPGPAGHVQHRRRGRRPSFRSIERALRERDTAGQRQYQDNDGPAAARHCSVLRYGALSGGFDASCALPRGTTLSTTRPFVRYLLATRFTSAGVTTSIF